MSWTIIPSSTDQNNNGIPEILIPNKKYLYYKILSPWH